MKKKLTLLYKDENSGGNGCPSVYLDDAGDFVVQGSVLDEGASAQLENVLPGEGAVRISREVILGAVERYHRRSG